MTSAELRSLDTLTESPDKRLTVRMTEIEYAHIAEIAESLGVSVNRVIRTTLWTCTQVAGGSTSRR